MSIPKISLTNNQLNQSLLLLAQISDALWSPLLSFNPCHPLVLFARISPTKRSTGTNGASCAASAATVWWTNRLAAKKIRFTAVIVTLTSSLRDATAAVKSSNQVPGLINVLQFCIRVNDEMKMT